MLSAKHGEIDTNFTRLISLISHGSFDEQRLAHVAGDEEAVAPDDDFVEALEYALAPTAGWGLGVRSGVNFVRRKQSEFFKAKAEKMATNIYSTALQVDRLCMTLLDLHSIR